MGSTDFLVKELKKIYSSLSYLEIRYEFRNNIKTHLIEVKPIHCFEKDRNYIFSQIDLEGRFEQLFPLEEILFMTDNVLIKIENPILELGTSSSVANLPVFYTDESTKPEFIHTELLDMIIASSISEEPLRCVEVSSLNNDNGFYYPVGYIPLEDVQKFAANGNNNIKTCSDINQSIIFC